MSIWCFGSIWCFIDRWSMTLFGAIYLGHLLAQAVFGVTYLPTHFGVFLGVL